MKSTSQVEGTELSPSMSAHPRRIVVKCGTRLLTRPEGLAVPFIEGIARQIDELRNAGDQVAYVTSGAIAVGRAKLPLADDGLVTRQVLAAIGQAPLMATYEAVFATHAITVAQTLLSRADLDSRAGYLNARNSLNRLLAEGVLPIANENDVVATEELHFGDNDSLSVLIAKLIDADQLIMLTSMEGLFMRDPRHDPDAQLIREAGDLSQAVLERAAGDADTGGSGGMRSKLQAATEAAADGIDVIIARGDADDVLLRIVAGERLGTHFAPTGPHRSSRERWISSSLAQRGTVEVDAGAKSAVVSAGRSLLPAGVCGVSGTFGRGDLVGVVGPDGGVFARGLVNYESPELQRICGRPSQSIASTLGYDNGAEAIHRNNLVVLEPGERERHA